MPPTTTAPAAAAPKRELTLFDSTCIIVGIIIGAGIYRSTPTIAHCVPSAGWLIAAWLIGGLFALIGALCYAELASAYPKAGGDYVYLTRAYDRPMGFLFAWAELWVMRPGALGVMAYAFAEYANRIWPKAGLAVDGTVQAGADSTLVHVVFAAGAIIVLSAINMLGVRQGKWTQNILTVAKFLGLVLIVVVGFAHSGHVEPVVAAQAAPAAPPAVDWSAFGLAMIFVLFTYGGWNEMGYVGAEVRNPERNILRALVLGTVAVVAIYVLVNLAFLHAVGFEGVRSTTVAADVVELALGDWAGIAISLLICISSLGVVNGQIFTGARVYYAMGRDHSLYSPLGRWNARHDTPLVSLAVQAAVTVALVVGFGLTDNGFDALVIFTAPPFWFFMFLVAMSVFVFRAQEPDTPRPYRVLGYPVTPLLLGVGSLYMLYSTVNHAISNRSWPAFWAIGIVAIGLALSFVPSPRRPADVNDAA
jgi:amino acid transporter